MVCFLSEMRQPRWKAVRAASLYLIVRFGNDSVGVDLRINLEVGNDIRVL